jgi:hypothetical protein
MSTFHRLTAVTVAAFGALAFATIFTPVSAAPSTVDGERYSIRRRTAAWLHPRHRQRGRPHQRGTGTSRRTSG